MAFDIRTHNGESGLRGVMYLAKNRLAAKEEKK